MVIKRGMFTYKHGNEQSFVMGETDCRVLIIEYDVDSRTIYTTKVESRIGVQNGQNGRDWRTEHQPQAVVYTENTLDEIIANMTKKEDITSLTWVEPLTETKI